MIERGSVYHKILQYLCSMPKAVRGASEGMLTRHFSDPDAVRELVRMGWLEERGWDSGPGSIWIPSKKGEAICAELIKNAALSPDKDTRDS